MLSFQDVTGVKGFISDHQIESVQFYLSDIDGRLRAVTIPAETFSEETLEMGIGFDASNFGFAGVERSDMILKPDLSYAFLDPMEDAEHFAALVYDRLKERGYGALLEELSELRCRLLQSGLQARHRHRGPGQ